MRTEGRGRGREHAETQNQASPDAARGGLADNVPMSATTDRFPLLRFVAWFAGLLLAATGLAMLIA